MSGLGDLSGYMNENWHGGQIEGDFFNHPEFDIEENLEVEEKSTKSVWNWKHAITRELMRGKHKYEILSKYKTVIDRFDINDEVRNFIDKNDGVLGYFIIDVSNFDDKFSYDDIPQELKDCNLYAINAIELREVINRSLVSENDGSLDGFLNSDETVDEEIYYIDECTGLPCIEGWDGESDDEDERLISIANLFLGKNWMTLSEKEKFVNMEGKLPYLVSIVKRAFTPKSNSNDYFEDDINDFGVKNQDLEADSQKAVKDVEVTNIHERKLDDIGNTDLAEKVNVTGIKERKLNDIGDVSLQKSYNIKKEINPNDSREDVKLQKEFEKVDIQKEFNPADLRQDVYFIKKLTEEDIDNTKESKMIEIETEIPDYGIVNDNMTELTEKDYRVDIEFDNLSDFVIDDIEEMQDDEFDYADLSDGNVDIDEMFDFESDKNEVNIEKVQEKVDISNRYDWSW